MFDADDDEPVCRAEDCPLEYVHPAHVYPLTGPAQPGKAPKPWWAHRDPAAHLKQDAEGLTEILRRAFEATEWPLAFNELVEIVGHEYGSVSERTIHRQLHELSLGDQPFILKLQLDLPFYAYCRATSRRLHDRENLREHMVGKHEIVPAPGRKRWGPQSFIVDVDQSWLTRPRQAS